MLGIHGPEKCVTEHPCKYTNVAHFAVVNMERLYNAKLDRGPSRNVLNIGSGSGILSYLLWKLFGHRVDSADISTTRENFDSHYPILASFFGVIRYNWRVTKYTPPPSWMGVYDTILIYSSVFNKFWTEDEYHYFLASLLPHVAPDGWVFWHSNKYPGAAPFSERYYSHDDLHALAEKRNDLVQRRRNKNNT